MTTELTECPRNPIIRWMGDWVPVALAAGLSLLGIVMILSIFGGAEASYLVPLKQFVWLLLAVAAYGLALRLDFDNLRDFVWPIAIAALLALLLVAIPGVGHKMNGARRWFHFGYFMVQVADLARIPFLMVLAHLLSHTRAHRQHFVFGVLVPLSVVGVSCALLLLQPDFGTAVLYAGVGMTLIFLAGAKLVHLAIPAVAGAAVFAVKVMLDPVRLARLTSFMDIDGNRSEGAYQLYQGLIGFAVGGWTGTGLGKGLQQREFLPFAHTDFIFPIVGEELGFIATSLVLLAFAVLAGILCYRSATIERLYPFLLATGCWVFVSYQALINLCVTTGLLPTKGMSLPFISYGGSNLVVSFFLVGMVINLSTPPIGDRVLTAREVLG